MICGNAQPNNLKPCPFCGGEAYLDYSSDNAHRPYVVCRHGCMLIPPCPMSHPYLWDYKTAEDAVEAWNKRYKED